MASRWAYEAMAVTQFKDNEFEKLIYDDKKNKINKKIHIVSDEENILN